MGGPSMNEAIVHINGVQLNVGQSMALRVAITSFLIRMQDDGLGESADGKMMAEAYIARASEIEQLLCCPPMPLSVNAYGPLGQCRTHGCSDPATAPNGMCGGHCYE